MGPGGFESFWLNFGGGVELKLNSDFIVLWIYHSSLPQYFGLALLGTGAAKNKKVVNAIKICYCIDYLNDKFYNWNVNIEFLKRNRYDYIRTNKSIMCENKYQCFRIGP